MNSRDGFINAVMNQFHFTEQEARHIYKVFIRENVLRVDKVSGSISLVHGAFWDKKVMVRALEA